MKIKLKYSTNIYEVETFSETKKLSLKTLNAIQFVDHVFTCNRILRLWKPNNTMNYDHRISKAEDTS